MLLAIDFQSLHEILRNLYTEMMPLCGQMTGVAKGWQDSVPFFMSPPKYGKPWHGQNDRRVSAASSLCPWTLYHVLSHLRTGHNECRIESDCKRNTQ